MRKAYSSDSLEDDVEAAISVGNEIAALVLRKWDQVLYGSCSIGSELVISCLRKYQMVVNLN
ncbi:hypothetical protein F511_47571 [Dorcoceras hygrometricum]|uniref:Uncharacterized protein n=1 Tax=Dorcoceras hygrometricum TaxID=472368 RepID=A0A2Z6ZQS5_9LAMI|nr:hypothetical protein F511_47571 [Dorcoceras hygrometricum]